MNKVILTGNLCKDIELRLTPNSVAVVSNSVAVSRDMKDANGNYVTDFIDIVVWNQSAEYLNRYAKKGDRVELCGRMQNRTYLTKEGYNRTITEVQVDNIKVFPRTPKEEEKPKEEPSNTFTFEDDELPF